MLVARYISTTSIAAWCRLRTTSHLHFKTYASRFVHKGQLLGSWWMLPCTKFNLLLPVPSLPLQMWRLTEPNLAGLPLMEESHILLVFQVQH